MNKKVLVVAYHYPPEEGSCSEKNIRIVKKLVDCGYKVVVLTKGYRGLLDDINSDSIKVIRTKKNGIFHKVQSTEVSSKLLLRKVNNSFLKKVKSFFSGTLVPDSVIDWVPQVKKLYYSNREAFKGVDIILSISSPYSAHIASQFISKKISIPYIMCYGDPLIYEPKRNRGKIRLMYEKRLEKKLLNDAKKVLLITEWNKKKYNEIYQIPLSKFDTYHIGYDETECLADVSSNTTGEFKIIYGGSLDSVHRDPEPFIKAMANIKDVKSYIYNSDNPNVKELIKRYGVENSVILKPIIGSSQFYRELYKMDALLLFGNKTPFQVPGKVFTYISTRKGIIYIKNNEYDDDGTKTILEEYGNSVIVPNEADDIVQCLEKMKQSRGSGFKVSAEKFEFHKTMQPIVDAIEESLTRGR